jgi:hypothetical protein
MMQGANATAHALYDKVAKYNGFIAMNSICRAVTADLTTLANDAKSGL